MAEQKATNVHWHEGDITREHREKLLGHKGATLWFTGLSGSGKSTVAVELEGILHEMGIVSYRLDGDNVRMGRDFVMEMVAKAPSRFTITPRNPDRKITIGEGHITFGNVSSPPNYYDLEIGQKVPGNRQQFPVRRICFRIRGAG